MDRKKRSKDSYKSKHDIFVAKLFKKEKNARDFLDFFLPAEIKNIIDLSYIDYDDTSYIAYKYKKDFSDIVIKTKIKEKQSDIYILIEHKSGFKSKEIVLMQLLKYIYLMWEHDLHNDNELRLIIPLILYHGKRKWTVPASFRDYFQVDEAIKPFILDFKYLLFNTNEWNESDDSALNKMHRNYQLFSSLLLLKTAFLDELETIEKLIRLWYDKGFFKKIDLIDFLFEYLLYIRNLSQRDLQEIFDKTQIEGGELILTLTEKWEKRSRIEIAKNLLDILDDNTIAEKTGLSLEEVQQLRAGQFGVDDIE